MIANRINFQRVYDLRDRVLPADTDSREPTISEMRRHLLENSAKSLGVSPLLAIADYTHVNYPIAKASSLSERDRSIKFLMLQAM